MALQVTDLEVWGLPFGVLIVALNFYNDVQPIRVWRPFVFLGDISYSLYLTHFQIVEFIRDHVIPHFTSIRMVGLLMLPYLAMIFVVGVVSYRCLERGLAEIVKCRLLIMIEPRNNKLRSEEFVSAAVRNASAAD